MKIKENKGISIISLIVTIIILLILASLSLPTLMNEYDIISQANNAKQKTNQAQIIEEMKLAFLNFARVENLEEKAQYLRENLGASVAYYDGIDSIIITYKGYKFKADNKNNLQIIENLDEWDNTATPEDVFLWESNDPTSPNYGTIIGYTEKAINYTTIKFPSRCNKIAEAKTTRSNTTNIEKVIIPTTLLKIDAYAFSTSISTATFPNLKEAIFEDGITSIGGVFRKNKTIEKVVLPDSVTTISDQAFQDCTNLKYINLPPNLTNIGYRAFNSCTKIESIIIPETVINIGMYAFAKWGTRRNHSNYKYRSK